MLTMDVTYQGERLPSKVGEMETLAERLKKQRARRGLSQRDLAGRLNMPQAQYARYEKGSDPRVDILARIARELQCTSDYLIGLVDQPSERLVEEDLPPDQRALLEWYRSNPKAAQNFRKWLAGGPFLDPGDLPRLPPSENNKPK